MLTAAGLDTDGVVFADSFTLDRDPGRVLATFREAQKL
jgi:hypothetical protein